MKKTFATISTLATTVLLSLPQMAYADQTPVNPCPTESEQFKGLCNLQFDNFLGPVVNFVFVIATLIALAYLLWGGIKWIMSEGDKNGVDGARQHIISALIGLVVIFSSYFILNLLLQFFTGSGLSNLKLPELPKNP